MKQAVLLALSGFALLLAVVPLRAERAASAVATVINGSVTSITVVDGGEGYLGVPPVSLIGGGGSGAAAKAALGSGVIQSISLTSGGGGYTNAPLVAIPPPSAFATNGLILYYPFINSLRDASGADNHGSSSVPIYVKDRFGNAQSAFFLNGAGNFIQSSNALPELQSATVSCWLSLDHWGDYQVLFFEGDDSPGHDLTGYFAGGLKFYTKGDDLLYYSNWFPPVNTWLHYVFVASAQAHTMETWVNGQKVSHGAFGSGANAGYHSQMNLGRRPGVYNDWYLTGAVDDVRVYNRALSNAEVAALYAMESGAVEGLEISVSAVLVTMNLIPGRRYQLESSPDLVVWVPVGGSFFATGVTYSQSFSVAPGTRYWRMVAAP